MKTYEVYFTRDLTVCIEVEAENKEEAEKKAFEKISSTSLKELDEQAEGAGYELAYSEEEKQYE